MAGWGQLLALIFLLVVVYRPLGDYMAWVYTSPRSLRVERWIYRACGINPDVEQRWSTYATSMLVFSGACVVLLYVFQRVQGGLPLNLGFGGVHSAQAFNTAVSFATNTNWQSYSGEQTMGNLVQMSGLAVQNFVSAAVGLAVAIAMVRGFIRAESGTVGNFWSDLVRSIVRILLPIAFVAAVFFVSQGMIQNLHGFQSVKTLDGGSQAIPGGPVASQESIKELGNNGGGFFNANSAHPFENPTPLTNFLEIFLLLVIPFSLAGTFGKMAGDRKQGYVLVGVMFGLWLASALVAWHYEAQGNASLPPLAGGNMTGKDVRFGVPSSALFAASTTGTSTGSVIASHDSFTPFGGAVPLVNIMLSEVTPGGVGAGLYGMLVLAVLSVFIAGLMVGRTPEYLGKKIQAKEMKLIALYILLVPSVVLVLTGVALVLPSARSSILNAGPHGLTEVLYAFTSGSNNNGSAFGGLNANTNFFNTSLGVAMILGRYALMTLALGLGGAVAGKKHVPESLGTFPTGTPLFGGLLTGVILIVTALTYFPALSLGPLAEGFVEEMIEPKILWASLPDAFRKLDPRLMMKNPVMFVVEVGRRRDHGGAGGQRLTLRRPDHAVALANRVVRQPGRGRGRGTREGTGGDAPRGPSGDHGPPAARRRHRRDGSGNAAGPRGSLRGRGRRDRSPGDGEVVEGVASVDESAITGESAPVIRESGGDRSAVTGGTKVLSDRIVVEITSKPGETFIDRMIALVEGAKRQKTPNEIALNILLASLTIIFLLATATLQPLAIYSGGRQSIVVLIALLVCLIPTTIGALLSAIGIAGMDRLVQRNVLAMSGRAVEAAGDVNTLLLDKTGTITLGNRQAAEFIPAPGVTVEALADAAQITSLADETPEGRSIVVLAKERYGLRGRELVGAEFMPFTAQTRMSGVDLDGRMLRKGAADSVKRWVAEQGGDVPEEVDTIVAGIAVQGGTPLTVAEGTRVLGVIYLKDIVKEGMRQRFDELRKMGIRTVMITGDNPRTAAAIAAEAGVDDFLAEATPEDKMRLIREEQAGGKLVAMTGDGTNDAPALAQADVGVAMNTGTSAAKEAGQHGRPRLEPDEADRDRRDRQAAADHARRPDDVLHRERRGEVLRDHPGDVRGGLPGSRDRERHAAFEPGVRDPVGRDLQRAHHRGPHPAVAEGGQVQARARRPHAPAQPGHLRAGRRHRALHRHQAGRRDRSRGGARVMRRQLLASIRTLLILTVVTGLFYPMAVTVIARVTMRSRAEGSLVMDDGRVVGSSLIGQSFEGDQWFQGRPDGYDPHASGPTNLGPTNAKLIDQVGKSIATLRAQDGLAPGATIPADAVTGSGSGLDPDISVAYARLQAPRVALARGMSTDRVLGLIEQQTSGRTAGFLGEPRVNVLLLNIALERLASGT